MPFSLIRIDRSRRFLTLPQRSAALFCDGGRAYVGRVARAAHRERAQASVETVALLPVLLILTVAVWQAVMAGWALVSAESAARAAARAALAGSPPRPAALAALPGACAPARTYGSAAGP